MKRFIKTSFPHQMGLKIFDGRPDEARLPRTNVRQAGRRVQKKSPAFALKTGDFTRLHPSQSYPRRPLREEYPGRFSDSPDLNSPSHPALRQLRAKDSGFFVKALIPKISGRDYSGGSVPDFLRLNGDHGVPFTWISPFEMTSF